MSQQITLRAIFEETKGEFIQSLSGLSLPKDTDLVQEAIVSYLNRVCDDGSAYRQNLTQSEDYILQAALSMLNAQRALVSALDCKPRVSIQQSDSMATPPPYRDNSTLNARTTAASVGGGAIVGKLLFGGWGAVFGAIAGTALAIYLSQKPQAPAQPSCPQPRVEIINTPVDSEHLVAVMALVFESLDNLIDTFRAQIQRVVHKYEAQERPSIERNYHLLLEGIQSLIGYKRGHSEKEDKYVAKLQTRVEDLAELLDNYGLQAIDYTPEHSAWYDAVESANATEIKLVTPAIIKGDALILKGKIFIPSKQ